MSPNIGALVMVSSPRRRASKPRMVAVPKGQIRRAGTRRVTIRTRPQVKAVRVKGQAKCDICLGLIKPGLPSVICGCGKQFHNSCAMRVSDCPICGKHLLYTAQRPHVVDSESPYVRTLRLSKDDKLLLLEERFLLGEITERTYISTREQIQAAPDSALFCSVCGRRLLEGESCDCTMYTHTFQCPECGEPLTKEDLFCRKCGIVFSTDFSKDLFQCPECGRIVAEDDRACECGALLVGEGNMLCPRCGREIPETAAECRFCHAPLVELISECPACGRRVDKDALACLCGVIFTDRAGAAECSVCSSEVSFEDQFCPKCGARFSDRPRLDKKVERKVRR